MASNNDSKYSILVDRKDQGNATIQLRKWVTDHWVVVTTAKKAGWDDAIPWKTGKYDGGWKQGGFSGFAAWTMTENFPDREGILLHTALASSPAKFPYSYGSYGCMVVDVPFLKAVEKAVGPKNGKPAGDIDFDVRGFNPKVGLTLSTTTKTVTEGEYIKLQVNLTGDATGVSKDCYVLVKDVKATGINATKGADYDLKPVGPDGKLNTADDSVNILKNYTNDAIKPTKAKIDPGDYYFIKIPKNKIFGTVYIDTKVTKDDADAELAKFQIVDYYFDSPNGKAPHRFYSDYLNEKKGKPKVLIQNGGDASETVTIKEDPGADPNQLYAVQFYDYREGMGSDLFFFYTRDLPDDWPAERFSYYENGKPVTEIAASGPNMPGSTAVEWYAKITQEDAIPPNSVVPYYPSTDGLWDPTTGKIKVSHYGHGGEWIVV